MPWLRMLEAASEAYTSSLMLSSRPAKRDSPCRTRSNFCSAVSPGTRLVVAIAPAFTSGFIVRSSFSSTAISELNGNPVEFTPSWCRADS